MAVLSAMPIGATIMNHEHRSPFAILRDAAPFDHLGDIGHGIGRAELLELARACGWPLYRDERAYEIAGERQWNEAPFTYAIDRRAAYQCLRAIGGSRQ